MVISLQKDIASTFLSLTINDFSELKTINKI